MITFGTEANGVQRRRSLPVDGGHLFYKSEWMDSGKDPVLSPTVAYIEQPTGYEFEPHFHRTNQFQIFTGGAGTIGKKQLTPVTVHYAGAYTGYGPLVATDGGIQYFTMRPVFESGFIPISELISKKIRGPKRHAQSQSIVVLSDEHRECVRTSIDSVEVRRGSDGLCVRNLTIPPGQSSSVAALSGSQGHFVFVLGGTIEVAGKTLRRWEQVYSTADERPISILAGDRGAQFLCLHVPAASDAYVDAPEVMVKTG